MLRRKIMVLYLTVVFVAMSIIAILNICLGTYNFDNYQLWVVMAVVLSTVVEIAIKNISIYNTLSLVLPFKITKAESPTILTETLSPASVADNARL